MAEGFDSPHLPSDVLTDVRFWMQMIRDSKRIIYCPPEMVERVQEAIDAQGMQVYFDVMASQVCPPNRILIVDQQATEAATNEAFQHAKKGFFS